MILKSAFNAVQNKVREKKAAIAAARAFHLLASEKHADNAAQIVQILKSTPAARQTRNGDGYTPLQVALYQDKLNAADTILRAFPEDADMRDKDGRTLLMGYATQGFGPAAQLLLARGADVALTDKNGDSALHYAMKNAESAFAAELLRRDAPVNAANNQGVTPLMLAAESDDKSLLLSCLLLARADLDMKDSSGQNATMAAIRWAAFDNAERLLKAGGTPDFDSPFMRHTVEAAQKENKQSFLLALQAAKPARTDLQKKCATEIAECLARGAGRVTLLKPVRFKN
ncbi:MAG: ankyrin repeat domain-containing protein [Micavibrio sp.]|nr:ankyrin repeat domain-containing protein [Micavibrio sp.]